jgi:uncharacterized protein (TIGR02266 family)
VTADRRDFRAPLQLAVSYRTTGAFLVAYSVNLSKGGIFIEAQPLPVGTMIHLELEVPEAGKLGVDGQVAWVRDSPALGLPVGMGIQFQGHLDERHGELIDRLVSSFEGLEILVMAAADRRAQLVRYVGSILSCETVEAEAYSTAEVVLGENIDLVIVDLESLGDDGRKVVELTRGGQPTPLIGLTNDPETAAWLLGLGVDDVLRSPPAFPELQLAVIHAVSRHMPVTAG